MKAKYYIQARSHLLLTPVLASVAQVEFEAAARRRQALGAHPSATGKLLSPQTSLLTSTAEANVVSWHCRCELHAKTRALRTPACFTAVQSAAPKSRNSVGKQSLALGVGFSAVRRSAVDHRQGPFVFSPHLSRYRGAQVGDFAEFLF